MLRILIEREMLVCLKQIDLQVRAFYPAETVIKYSYRVKAFINQQALVMIVVIIYVSFFFACRHIVSSSGGVSVYKDKPL